MDIGIGCVFFLAEPDFGEVSGVAISSARPELSLGQLMVVRWKVVEKNGHFAAALLLKESSRNMMVSLRMTRQIFIDSRNMTVY